MLIFFKVCLLLRLNSDDPHNDSTQPWQQTVPYRHHGINAASFVLWFLIYLEENVISHKLWVDLESLIREKPF